MTKTAGTSHVADANVERWLTHQISSGSPASVKAV